MMLESRIVRLGLKRRPECDDSVIRPIFLEVSPAQRVLDLRRALQFTRCLLGQGERATGIPSALRNDIGQIIKRDRLIWLELEYLLIYWGCLFATADPVQNKRLRQESFRILGVRRGR